GGHDWISFNRRPDLDFDAFARARGIDLGKPIIGLLTNVFWDAQLHYPANAFASMREWLVETVRYFAGRADLQLVIRAHPAETTGAMPARETAASIIAAAIGELPANVFLVDSSEAISTYVIARHCRACIIFATKAGIELLAMGIPVIAAGEAWVRGKGMAGEAEDKKGYFALLDRLPDPPRDMTGVVERAERYAFHFFFRRMIPVRAAVEAAGWPPFDLKVDRLAELEAGADLGLDIICAGILEGAPFEYPAERLIDGPEL
ncbi:MAG TPA: capsular biosynthesis protein, partial [Hyphomicrobiaceae bacterium]|nr:capsular biosynthesis protein [Hyphomicrobiaceae bacterium]